MHALNNSKIEKAPAIVFDVGAFLWFSLVPSGEALGTGKSVA